MENPRETNPFNTFFAEAEAQEAYWVERAKLDFTEAIVARMEALGFNRKELALRLGVQQGFVTRLLSGANNFELATMVRIARALGAKISVGLQVDATKNQSAKISRKRSPTRGTSKDNQTYSTHSSDVKAK